MKICTNCRNVTNDDNMNFCPLCGAPLAALQPAPQPEVNQFYAEENYPKPSLGLKIAAMVLSITGFSCLFLGFFYTLIGLTEEGVAFGMALTFSLFFLPLCIVGMVLSNKCQNAGDNSAFSRLGKIFGLIGIIIAAVSMFIGFVSLAAI